MKEMKLKLEPEIKENYIKEALKDPFANGKFSNDHVETKIKIANIFHLMGYYFDDEKAIYICPKNILDTADVFYNFYNTNNYTKKELYNIFLKTTFFHELGHAIFSCKKESDKDKSIRERQANYISSFATFGEYDDIIANLSLVQPKIYQNPLLTLQHHFNHSPIYSDEKKYDEEVDKLFKGNKNE